MTDEIVIKIKGETLIGVLLGGLMALVILGWIL